MRALWLRPAPSRHHHRSRQGAAECIIAGIGVETRALVTSSPGQRCSCCAPSGQANRSRGTATSVGNALGQVRREIVDLAPVRRVAGSAACREPSDQRYDRWELPSRGSGLGYLDVPATLAPNVMRRRSRSSAPFGNRVVRSGTSLRSSGDQALRPAATRPSDTRALNAFARRAHIPTWPRQEWSWSPPANRTEMPDRRYR